MVAGRSISFDIAALDRASQVLEDVGDQVAEVGHRIEQASGTIEIDADTAAATAAIRQVEAQMARLDAKRIKVDADIAAAERQVAVLEAELARTTDPQRRIEVDADITKAKAKLDQLKAERVAVDADTTAAEAKLTALAAKARELDGKKVTVEVEVDADRGVTATQRLERALQSVGSWAEKLGRSVASGALSMATGIGMVAVKAGVLIAVLAEVQSAAMSVSVALSGIGAVGVAGFATIKAGFVGIGEALTAMDQKATGGGAAVKASAAEIQAATQGVRDAEADLATAQEDERRSQEDLTQAHEDAARTLRDLALQTEDMSLRQEGAAISVARAEERLNEVKKDSKSTSLDRAEAELRLHEALQRQKETSIEATDLAAKKAEADSKGVEGSDAVVAANHRVQDSHRAVDDAIVRLAQSQQQLSDTMNPKSGGGGVDKLAEAFESLGPKAQAFARYLKGFIDGPLKDLRQSGQEAFLPQLEAGMKKLPAIMKSTEPAFAQFSAHLGKVVADLLPELAKLAKPFLHFADQALKGLESALPGLKAWLAKVGKWFEDMAGSGQAQAKTKEFIDKLVDGVKQLPGFLAEVKGILDDMKVVLDQIIGVIDKVDGWKQNWDEFTGSLPRPPGLPEAYPATHSAEFLPQPRSARGMSAPALSSLAPEPDLGWTGRWQTTYDSLRTQVQGALDAVRAKWSEASTGISTAIDGIGVWISTKWTSAYEGAKTTAQGALAWVRAKWGELGLGISTALDGVQAWISTKWTSAYEGAKTTAQGALAWVRQQWESLVSGIQGIPGRISGALSKMWDPLWSTFRSIVNRIISGWNNLSFSVPAFNPGIPGMPSFGGWSSGPGLGHPLTALATGGIVTGPTLALLGDNRSRREAVVPLERAGEFGFGRGGRAVVELHLHGVWADQGAVARGMVEGLQTAVLQGLLPPSVLGGAAAV